MILAKNRTISFLMALWLMRALLFHDILCGLHIGSHTASGLWENEVSFVQYRPLQQLWRVVNIKLYHSLTHYSVTGYDKYVFRNRHYKHITTRRPSQFYNGYSYANKMVSSFFPWNFISHHAYIPIHFDSALSTKFLAASHFSWIIVPLDRVFHTYQRRSGCYYNADIFSMSPHMIPLSSLFMASHVSCASRPLLLCCPGHYRDICNIMLYLDHVLTAPCSIAITLILAYIFYIHPSSQIFV